MNTESVHWSEQKQQCMQEQLVGCWVPDTWELVDQKGKKRYLHFSLTSPSLKTELKYAFWYKFDSGAWNVKKEQGSRFAFFTDVVTWLNQIAPTALSLLEKPLEYWVWSLRSYLVETNKLKQTRGKRLLARQEYREYVRVDGRISLF